MAEQLNLAGEATKQPETKRRSTDREFSAMRRVIETLESLDTDERIRVLEYVSSRVKALKEPPPTNMVARDTTTKLI